MKSRKVQIVLALVISGVCLYLYAKDQDWPAVWSAMTKANYIYVMMAIGISILSMLIRAFRWQSLLGEPRVSIRQLFLISNIGFMGNGIFPARMGELIRPFLVWKTTPHKFSTALATIVVERVYDLLGLLTILAFVLVVFPFETSHTPSTEAVSSTSMTEQNTLVSDPETAGRDADDHSYFLNPVQAVKDLAFLGVFVFFLLFAVIAVMSFAPETSLNIARKMFKPFPESISQKLLHAIESFEQGASTLRSAPAFLYCLFWTMFLWLSIAFGELIVVWAFGADIGFAGSLFLMVGLCFAVMFPQAPGYIGVYQLAVYSILVYAFGVDKSISSAAAWIMWLTQVPAIIATGFISLVIMGISFQEISHLQEEVSESPAIETSTESVLK